MLIPFVRCFNIIMVTDFPVNILSNTIVSIYILIWGKNSAPWDEVVNSLGTQNLHLGSVPSWRILAWKFLVKWLWSCAATINPSVSTLSPALLSHWWVSCKSTSAFWLQSGYWPCNSFDFQTASIAFSIDSLFVSNSFQLSSIFYVLHLLVKFSFKI